jgi:spore cortex biosynthesis protein YabQ
VELRSQVLEQFLLFAESLAFGVILGAGFDIYRALRLQFKQRPFAASSVIADCLFWVGAAAVCILVILARRWGQIYLYSYLAIAGGFIGYIYFFSRFLLPPWICVFRNILHFMFKVYYYIVKVVHIIAGPLLGVTHGIAIIGDLLLHIYSRISHILSRRISQE